MHLGDRVRTAGLSRGAKAWLRIGWGNRDATAGEGVRGARDRW